MKESREYWSCRFVMIIASNSSLIVLQISKWSGYFRVHVHVKCFVFCCDSWLSHMLPLLNIVLYFAVELLLLTKCDRLLLLTESTVTSLIRSLVPYKPTEYIGAMQAAAHLLLLLGVQGEHMYIVFRGQREVAKLWKLNHKAMASLDRELVEDFWLNYIWDSN